ncbi:MAG: radical SAM protein [Ruminococcaceae bacterium]|nr:radical SAM protein [Oscillospiraceae bacterium]
MKNYNVSIFVPHEGCPNNCSFCNQKSISGKTSLPTEKDVVSACEIAIKTAPSDQGEIAFFGGSFTAIERNYMLTLLKSAYPFVKEGFFKGIRISTRPDCIDNEICTILKTYGVTSVELGCQSMDEEVLKANLRGHTSHDVEKAVKILRKFGFETGLQMMTGLYKSSFEKDVETAEKIIALKPDTVRIYPTIVLENTLLEEKFKSGEYKVMSLEETVELCAKLLLMFEDNNIAVIRTGLHSGGNVEEGYVAGAYHPAFKELCESEIYFSKITEQLKSVDSNEIEIFVPYGSLSQCIGQKKKNKICLEEKGYKVKFIEDKSLKKYNVKCCVRK